ncbi:MAG: YlmC/YmxH family sporulation protein [bacterium]|nr:YlmC/YmxH family sporulation protein [bacterium]
MRICDLRQKEVINAKDCKRLGYVADVDFNIDSGCILAIIVPGPACFCGFLGREKEYVIPFCDIKKIGEDIILVDVAVKDVTEKCGI